jgi:hypothetical protein
MGKVRANEGNNKGFLIGALRAIRRENQGPTDHFSVEVTLGSQILVAFMQIPLLSTIHKLLLLGC